MLGRLADFLEECSADKLGRNDVMIRMNGAFVPQLRILQCQGAPKFCPPADSQSSENVVLGEAAMQNQ